MPKEVVVALIEDDPAVNEAMVLLLESAGYTVQAYPSIRLFEQAQNLQPDLYLIDHQLDRENGLDLCRLLKGDPNTRHRPVIMMSASIDVADQSAEAGADAFLAKPFTKGHLQTLLRQMLSP